MGSKKNKRANPQGEIVELEKSSRVSTKRKLEPDEDDMNVVLLEVPDCINTSVKPKKKKKDNREMNVKTETVENGIGSLVKKEMKKEVNVKHEEIKLEDFQYDVQELVDKPKEITMPQNDLVELLRRMELFVPADDSLSFRCRLEKINWNEIAFSSYSAEFCKETWVLVQKKVRCFRILKEVLEDAKEYVMNPPKVKRKIISGMPPKPPTSYQLFYKKKKPSLIMKTPGLELGEISRLVSQMFKNLSKEKKAKYDKIAQEAKEKYEEDLKVFYENHPEIQIAFEKSRKSDRIPKRPKTPFSLYYENQLKKTKDIDVNDIQARSVFKEKCREQWKDQLSVKKKVFWITKSEHDILRFQEDVKEYQIHHPDYVPLPIKATITKDELALKDKLLGKPDKPPSSAYSLYSRLMMQSEEIKQINSKERMNYIATKWKNCSEEEKADYKERTNKLLEQYKKDFLEYLESLPEEKKQIELQKSIPKRKKPDYTKKKKSKKEKTKKMEEPVTPPISAFRYFANIKNLDDKIAKKEWKKLLPEEQEEYEKKLVEIKREYILEFERFLNSLTKEELEEYSKSKQQLTFRQEDFVDEEGSSSNSNSDNENEIHSVEDDSD